jgi:hypothetical protein
MEELENDLKDYVATYNNPVYAGDWDVVNGLFTQEIEKYNWDTDVLKDYVATANNDEYNGDYSIINAKFQDDLFKQKEIQLEEVVVRAIRFKIDKSFFGEERESFSIFGKYKRTKSQKEAAEELNEKLNGIGIYVEPSGVGPNNNLTISVKEINKKGVLVDIEEYEIPMNFVNDRRTRQLISLSDGKYPVTPEDRSNILNSIINNRVNQLQNPESEYYDADFDFDLYKQNYEKISLAKLETKDGKEIDIEKADFEQLLNHRDELHLEITTDFYKSEKGQKAIQDINIEINTKLSDLTNNMQQELYEAIELGEYATNKALKKFEKQYQDIISEAWFNNKDVKTMLVNNNISVNSIFGKRLNKLNRKRAIQKQFGNTIANYGFLTGLARTGRIQIPMAIKQFEAINYSRRIEKAKEALEKMSKLSDDDVYNYGYTADITKPENKKYNIPLGNYKVKDLKVMLQKQIEKHNETILSKIYQATEYQEILNKMPSPQLFKDGKLNLSLNNYSEALGDQTAQLMFSWFSGGMSTMVQEAGAAFDGIVRGKAEEIVGKEKWKTLDAEQKLNAMLEVINSGGADINVAMKVGGINTALDMSSNAFFVGKMFLGKKAKSEAIKSLEENFKSYFALMIQGRYREALKNVSAKQLAKKGKDIGQVTILEAFTEAGQEEVMNYAVGTSLGNYKHNFDQTFNAFLTAFLTTPILGAGSKVTSRISNEISARIQMINNPDGVLAFTRNQIKELERLRSENKISEQKFNELADELIAAEKMYSEGNLQVKDKDAVLKIFNEQKSIIKKEKQRAELKDKLTKLKEDRTGPVGTLEEVQTQIEINEVEQSIRENKKEQAKARYADFYKTEGFKLANEANNDPQINKNWQVHIFDNTQNGLDFLTSIGIDQNDVQFSKFKDGDNAFILSREEILKFNPNYDGKGVAIISNENVTNNINEGDAYAANAVHHELEHLLMSERFKGPEGDTKLLNLRNSMLLVIKDLASKDKQMEVIDEYLQERLDDYRRAGVNLNERGGIEEFFAALSDVTRGLSLTQDLSQSTNSAYYQIGKLFKDLLHGDRTVSGFDNILNTIDFIKAHPKGNDNMEFDTTLDENGNQIIQPKLKYSLRYSLSASGKENLTLIRNTNPYKPGRSNREISDINDDLAKLIKKHKEYKNPDNLELQKKIRADVSRFEQLLIYNNMGAFEKVIKDNWNKNSDLAKIAGNEDLFIGENLLEFTKYIKLFVRKIESGEGKIAPFGAYYFGEGGAKNPATGQPIMNPRTGKFMSIADAKVPGILNKLDKKFKEQLDDNNYVPDESGIDINEVIEDSNERSVIRQGVPGMEENTENYNNWIEEQTNTMSKENFDWEAFMTDPDALSKLDKKGKKFYTQLKNSFSEKTYKNYNHTQFYIDYITKRAKDIYMQLDQKTMNTAFTEFTEIDPTAKVSKKTGRLTVEGSEIKYTGEVKSRTAGNVPRRKLKWNDDIEAQFIERLLRTDQIERLKAEGKTTAEIHKLVRVDMLQKSTFEHLSKILFKDAMMQTVTSDEFKAANGIGQAEIARMALLVNKGTNTRFSLASGKTVMMTPEAFQHVGMVYNIAEQAYYEDKVPGNAIRGILDNIKLKNIPKEVKEELQIAYDFVASLFETDIVESAESSNYTTEMKKNQRIGLEVRENAKKRLKFDPDAKQAMVENAEIIIKELNKIDPQILAEYVHIASGNLEIFGFISGSSILDITKGEREGVTPGEFLKDHKRLLKLIAPYDNKGKSRIYNKNVPLKRGGVYLKLMKIQDAEGMTIAEKIEEIEKSGLLEEMQEANEANIEKFKTINKVIAKLVKDGKLDEVGLIQMLKAQSSLTYGYRGLSRTVGLMLYDGKFKFNPKEEYFPDDPKKNPQGTWFTNKKGEKVIRTKGEHAASISQIDTEMLDLIYRYKEDPTIDLDAEMDVILAGYNQVLGNEGDFSVLDKYGRTNISGTYRFNVWDRKTQAKYYSLTGGSLKDMQKQILLDKETKVNVIKTKKKAEAIEKINRKTTVRGTIQGATVMDFDLTVGVSENYVIARKDGKTRKLSAVDWPTIGEEMKNQGWKMDFSNFNKVTDGKPGPLFEKLKNQIKKYGVDNVYILTARAAESAPAIQAWLASEGINLPLENITGLGNSTGQAKADWIENNLILNGFNDIYFVDDHHENVDAVRQMFDQYPEGLLVEGGKSIIVNPVIRYSIDGKQDLSTTFNEIIETSTGIKAYKTFSAAQGKIRGNDQRSVIDVIYPPSAYDLEMFTYRYITKGELGENQQAFFQEKLFKPFETAINKINQNQQRVKKEYRDLVKQLPTVRKNLGNTVEGTNYTYDQAVRVYLWTKNNMEVPGLSKTDQKALVKAVSSDPELIQFADQLSVISQQKEGYIEPTEYWTIENIAYDLNTMTGKVSRAQYLAEWKENISQLFSEENKNKLRAAYGNDHVEALEDMLFRMEFGRNKTRPGRIETAWNNWVNNSVGAIMFFNMRSAALQTISAVNYVDWQDNNVYNAAKAFANQPQYWKDFTYIFNSDYLKERRAGSKRTINEAELTAHLKGSTNKAKAAIAWLLNKGFLPTQIADSFAIASGGASYYRNKIIAYEKQGMSTIEAEKQAFLDFQQKTEYGQQSSRPDLISQQQSGGLGRLILAFKNTPMQYNRLMIKAALDLKNGRGSTRDNMSKIAYYGFAQNLIFTSLQTALWTALGSEDEWDTKKERLANNMIDSILNGLGLTGAVAVTIKNGYLQYTKQRKRGYKGDQTYTLIQFANLSPTIGSKLRKLYGAITTEQYNRDAIEEMGFSLENPAFNSLANLISATTNVPLDRAVQKAQNIILASKSETEAMDKFALLMGYNPWDLGIETEAKKVGREVKKRKIKEKKEQKRLEKEQKQKEKEEKNKKVIEENKKKSEEDGRCAAISSGGRRCKRKAVSGGLCTIHEKKEQRQDAKKVQCKKIKSNGNRCKMQTNNKSGLCYYHD